MKRILICVCAVVMLSGCASTVVEYQGVKIQRRSFATKLSIPRATIEVLTNGTKRVSVDGFQSDQISGLEAVSKGATAAAIEYFSKQVGK